MQFTRDHCHELLRCESLFVGVGDWEGVLHSLPIGRPQNPSRYLEAAWIQHVVQSEWDWKGRNIGVSLLQLRGATFLPPVADVRGGRALLCAACPHLFWCVFE